MQLSQSSTYKEKMLKAAEDYSIQPTKQLTRIHKRNIVKLGQSEKLTNLVQK